MSYDLEIRSDARYTQTKDLRSLHDFVMTLPHIRCYEIGHYDYEEAEEQMRMEIDLSVVDEAGNTLDRSQLAPVTERRINCIMLHIPYGRMYQDYRFQRYLDVAQHIAAYVGWELLDLQEE